jgi:hypothetical protein
VRGVVRKLYPKLYPDSEKEMETYRSQDEKQFRANISAQVRGAERVRITVTPTPDGDRFVLQKVEGCDRADVPTDYSWLSKTGYAKYCKTQSDYVITVLDEIEKHQVHVDMAFDNLLGIGEEKSKI